MSHYKPYLAYKNSGVEWIGEVPEHWERRKISHSFFGIGSGTTPPTNEEEWYSDEGIPWITTGELRESVINTTSKYVTSKAVEEFAALRVFPAGALAIAMYGATIGRLGILGVPATTNQACCVLYGEKSLNIRFAYYWLFVFKPEIIELFAVGGGQPNINQEVVASLKIPAPSIDEQSVITAVLNRATTRIDALISKKTRFIELLKEKRSALITHAVTKGLDPNAKMKDSGVEWIGEVPEHWFVGRLRDFCASISTGPFGTALGVSDYIEGGIPVINPSHMNDGVCNPDRLVTISEKTAGRLAYWTLCEGDLVAARRGELGRAAIITSKEAGWICGTGSLRLAPITDKALPTYLYSVLQSGYARAWLDRESVGSTMPNLNESLAGRLPVVIPPSIAEQAALLARLDQLEQRVAKLTTKIQRSIDLLKERRSTLITAAVTGKIDVREICHE
ncbi:MAG: restriction endonuclease subunit S [Burkholderiales bacterium]